VLFSAACALGAYIAKCPQEVSRSLVKLGLYYGMAFQIKDDINNYTKLSTRRINLSATIFWKG